MTLNNLKVNDYVLLGNIDENSPKFISQIVSIAEGVISVNKLNIVTGKFMLNSPLKFSLDKSNKKLPYAPDYIEFLVTGDAP
jgi:hypothetical protein